MAIIRNTHLALSDVKAIQTPYYQDMIAGKDEEVKRQQRLLVRDFLLSHQKGNRLITMPGGTWAFENLYLNSAPNAKFVGIEKNEAVFNRSLAFMPGQRRRELYVQCNHNKKETLGVIQGIQSESALYLHCHLSTYLTSLKDGNNKAMRDVHAECRRGTGIWIDITSPICDSLTFALKRLATCMDFTCEAVPVVISYMSCRDPSGLVPFLEENKLTRAMLLMDILNQSYHRQFSLVSEHNYVSHENTYLQTLFTVGTLQRKKVKHALSR